MTAQAEKKRKLSEDAEKAATKAKRKVEKLRKQLEKEEKRIAKAEAKTLKSESEAQKDGAELNASGKRKRSCSQASSNVHVAESSTTDSKEQAFAHINQPAVKTEPDIDISRPAIKAEPDVQNEIEDSNTKSLNHPSSSNARMGSQEAVRIFPDPLTPTSQPPDPGDDIDAKVFRIDGVNIDSKGSYPATCKTVGSPDSASNMNNDEAIQDRTTSMANSSSEAFSTDSDDLTSSSGSSSTLSDSDDDAPDEAPSRRNGPDVIPPPKREKPKKEKPKRICRSFLASGRCSRGDSCRFRHELPERGSHGVGQKDEKRTQGRAEKVGLYQRVSVAVTT